MHTHTHTHTPVARFVISYKVTGWRRRRWKLGEEDSENAAMGTVTCLLAFSGPV